MQPLVSVIIPSYNCEQHIEQTLQSILEQSHSNIEIIVVDDGSTDKTRQIITTYKERVSLVQQQNHGVCSARNSGLKLAKGDYICFMDHDDYWFPDKISKQVIAFQENPETGVVYSEFLCWHSEEDGAFPSPDLLKPTNELAGYDPTYSGWIYHLLLLDCWVLTSTAMIRADLFKVCGRFDELLPYSEDWDLWLRFSQQFQFIKLRQTTTLYRQHLLQGNKKLRNIDYRTKLLLNAKRKWGLCSHDGKCLSNWQFRRQIADYHASFGLNHLYQNGNFILAINSIFKAWLSYPLKLKYLAYLIAALIGWRPKW